MYNFRTEFPDFDPATMPAIPFEWKDTSWCNDTCPSFAAQENITVFVDYEDINLREMQDDYPRFHIQSYDAEGNAISELITDDWDKILDYFKA